MWSRDGVALWVGDCPEMDSAGVALCRRVSRPGGQLDSMRMTPVLTVYACARLLDIDTRAVEELLDRGVLPSYVLGTERVVREEELVAYARRTGRQLASYFPVND